MTTYCVCYSLWIAQPVMISERRSSYVLIAAPNVACLMVRAASITVLALALVYKEFAA